MKINDAPIIRKDMPDVNTKKDLPEKFETDPAEQEYWEWVGFWDYEGRAQQMFVHRIAKYKYVRDLNAPDKFIGKVLVDKPLDIKAILIAAKLISKKDAKKVSIYELTTKLTFTRVDT